MNIDPLPEPLDLSSESDRVLGASYVAAVLTGDQDMRAMYRQAFTAEQLLAATERYVLIMGRRIAVDSARPISEVADTFIRAAVIQQAHDL